jgi:carbamoyl-phosphate synthase small subunit
MNASSSQPVDLFLECGARFSGKGFGDFSSPRSGEFVFCTAMSGIEESLTDPSFAGQILVSTASHVGNTGFTNEDMESGRIWAEGLVCRHLEAVPSNWRSKKPLGDWILDEKRFAVSEIDTRQLTSLLREEGSQRGIVVASGSMTPEQARGYIQKSVPDMKGRDLTGDVTCAKSFTYAAPQSGYWPYFLPAEAASKEARPLKVAVWDFGV